MSVLVWTEIDDTVAHDQCQKCVPGTHFNQFNSFVIYDIVICNPLTMIKNHDSVTGHRDEICSCVGLVL